MLEAISDHPTSNPTRLAQFIDNHDVAGVLNDAPSVYGPNDTLDVMGWASCADGRLVLEIETIRATATSVRDWLGY